MPAADQGVHPTRGGTAEPLPLSEWELIAEVGVEGMPETEGRNPPAEAEIERIQDRFRLIRARVGGAARVEIERLREGVVGLEGQAAAGSLDDGDIE